VTAAFPAAAFREALARFASGVTVVTVQGSGAPVGFTASAFASASLAPPLVLVCVGRPTRSREALVREELFGVSILSDRQAWIADQFARPQANRFDGVSTRRTGRGRPLLVDGALVQLECRRFATHEAGDHTVLIGEVLAGSLVPGGPLIRFGRGFGGFESDCGVASET
jgi:flavin reductase (DIM6/NTAB) family NADH-FMN oxidoreductase RutF